MKQLILFTLCLFVTQIYGQELETEVFDESNEQIQNIDSLESNKIKRVSLGIKLGIPNIAGVSLEGISPILGNRIAPFFDYSSFPVNTEETEIDLIYSEFGSNFYFGNQGNGVYFGIGFGALNTDIVFKDVTLKEDGNQGTGEGKNSYKVNTTNLKLGIKTGGKVYFRLELGYGIGSIPDTVKVKGTFTYEDSNGVTLTDSGTGTEEFPPIPGVTKGGVLVGNFGFGISF
tara:strand:+ start:10287 stop:10976 length:690 start_codon:yes stop_codon:yes gene_type:complete